RVPKKETHCRDLESTSKTMADFALGLTKTAVEGTLSRVKSAIEEEAKLKEKVHQDLVFIIGEFQMMQSFLETAKWERAKNKVANTWVRQLRELAFDVEDCVEFVVHLDKDSAWWWRVVPSCMAPPRHLDEAAAEIKQLKARVEDVSHRNMRNNLISDSGSHSKIVMPMAPAATTSSPLAFDNLRQVWEAAGKIRDTGDLQDLIRHEDSDLRVISVWGSTGDDLGMTSIFSKAYCGKKISQEFKSRAWVKLIHPFNPEEFLKNLLTQFYESSHQANVDVGHLNKAQLMQQVMEHKYLIIVEGVSTVVEWNAIKMYLPNNKKGSRILVSTQDLGIALQSPGEPYLVSELGRFSDGKSLCAFFKRVLGPPSDE
uniref:Rx N-terminal domain-containing protein n=1 Tax=Aegilops tauschii subsp. strangulata TaxID=200361 RepID=A0A453JC74_AEGTS